MDWESPCLNYCSGTVGAREECDWVFVPGDYPSIRAALNAIASGSPREIILTDSLYTSPDTTDANQNLTIPYNSVTIRSQSGDPEDCRIVLSVPSPEHRFAAVSGSLELEGVTIAKGLHLDPGGTIRVAGPTTLRNCVIDSSRASDGGAFAVEASWTLTLAGCRIQRCSSNTGGAGVVRGTLHADRTLFWANDGYKVGQNNPYAGGVYVASGDADFDQCTFAANTGATSFGASAIYASVWATVQRSIIAMGSAGKPVVECSGTGAVTASCTDVWGNGYNWYGCLDGQGGSDGNFSLDPGFCDASAGNFHSDSLYICCGDCGQIGAYDSVCVASKMSAAARPVTFLRIMGRNPASAPVLRFGFGAEGIGVPVDVSIYDVTGRRVRKLYAGVGSDLPQTAVWDGSGDSGQKVASGVYFARLSVAGGSPMAQRVVILR